MALSMSIPTASAIPPRLITFSEMSQERISPKVTMTEAGIVSATISVARILFKNKRSTKTASRAP